jgi:hypothetical protein
MGIGMKKRQSRQDIQEFPHIRKNSEEIECALPRKPAAKCLSSWFTYSYSIRKNGLYRSAMQHILNLTLRRKALNEVPLYYYSLHVAHLA